MRRVVGRRERLIAAGSAPRIAAYPVRLSAALRTACRRPTPDACTACGAGKRLKPGRSFHDR